MTEVVRIKIDDSLTETVKDSCDVRLAAGYWLASAFPLDGWLIMIFQPRP